MDSQVPQSAGQIIAPYLPILTPFTILLVVWRARGFVEMLKQVKNVQLAQIQQQMENNTVAINDQTKEIKGAVQEQTTLIREEFRDQRRTFTDTILQLTVGLGNNRPLLPVGTVRAKRSNR